MYWQQSRWPDYRGWVVSPMLLDPAAYAAAANPAGGWDGGTPWHRQLPWPPAMGGEEELPPTYRPHQAQEFPVQELRGISRRTQENHLGLYRGYVENTNAARRDLWQRPARETSDPNYSVHRSQRLGQIYNWNGVKNHEMYFSILSSSPRPLAGPLREMVERDFGSVDRFLADFKAAALAMRGWAMLIYDLDDERLHIFAGDLHDHAVWNSVLLMGIDVYEHAYFIDRGRDRGPYVDAFLANLDWEAVAERARRYGVIR